MAALTAPTLNETSGLDIFRLFLLWIGYYLFNRIDKTMWYKNLSADPHSKRRRRPAGGRASQWTSLFQSEEENGSPANVVGTGVNWRQAGVVLTNRRDHFGG